MDIQEIEKQWLTVLNPVHKYYSIAISHLSKTIKKALTYSFSKSYKLNNEAIEDATQEALINILNNKDKFQNRSSFKTWAIKVAINTTLSNLRKKMWTEVHFEDFDENEPLVKNRYLISLFDGPEKKMRKKEIAKMVNDMIENVLSEKQKKAIKMIMIYGMPLEQVAERMQTNRNNLYKLLHDGKIKIKQKLKESGMDINMLLASIS